jgi:hypothetical protein
LSLSPKKKRKKGEEITSCGNEQKQCLLNINNFYRNIFIESKELEKVSVFSKTGNERKKLKYTTKIPTNAPRTRAQQQANRYDPTSTGIKICFEDNEQNDSSDQPLQNSSHQISTQQTSQISSGQIDILSHSTPENILMDPPEDARTDRIDFINSKTKQEFMELLMNNKTTDLEDKLSNLQPNDCIEENAPIGTDIEVDFGGVEGDEDLSF